MIPFNQILNTVRKCVSNIKHINNKVSLWLMKKKKYVGDFTLHAIGL